MLLFQLKRIAIHCRNECIYKTKAPIFHRLVLFFVSGFFRRSENNNKKKGSKKIRGC